VYTLTGGQACVKKELAEFRLRIIYATFAESSHRTVTLASSIRWSRQNSRTHVITIQFLIRPFSPISIPII